MRIVLAAFACEPGRGSEPGLGWATASSAVRAGFNVTLVTEPLFRASIERARQDDQFLHDHLDPIYIGLPAPVRRLWEDRLRLLGFQLYNLVWQLMLFRTVRARHRQHPFDSAHHVTLTTDWVPTGLAFVQDLPLVWGPLGGAVRVPKPCRRFLSTRGKGTELARRLTADPLRVLAGSRAARRSTLLLAANPEEAARLQEFGPPVRVHPNVFVSRDWFAGPAEIAEHRSPEGGPPRAVFVGRLMSWKGVYLALAAMQEPEVSDWQLHYVGDGPERKRLERLIAQRGLGDRVRIEGWSTRAEVRAALLGADAFLYPSMREASPWVVAEALGVGCPVVCLDVGGPPLFLRGTGVAVPPGDRAPEMLAAALVQAKGMERRVVKWGVDDLPDLLHEWYVEAIGIHLGIRHAASSTVGKQ
jgi:glycosyltransferase involved in cell wall biosynthesis